MKASSHLHKIGLTGLLFLTLGAGVASADVFVWATDEPDGFIDKVDLTTNTVTAFSTPGVNPDSLVFSGSNILFTEVGQGTLALFNTTTHAVSTIATGFSEPRDLILDPGGATALVADYVAGKIDRVNLTTHAVTTLSNFGTGIDGLAYDGSGDLFAVINRHQIDQINPTTGAIIKSTATFDNNLDGLTYDPTTGDLFVASESGHLYEIPTSLVGSTEFSTGVGQVDGLEADGLGNIFMANFGTNVQEFNISTHVVTNLTSVTGIDDLAPITGNGAPPSTPEPGSVVLLGTLAALIGVKLRKKLA